MIREAKTENGVVRGLPAADPRVTSFKGIPFAAPPVGENRWRAPQPAKDWEGVLEAYQFAPISVQDQPGVGTDIYCREWHVDPDIPMNEDCLYLNVWTNAKSTEENLPVLVWFFGGGLQWGYPAEMEFDGERIARRGVVVVSVNYRLNVFGFLAHPQITKEQPDAPGNFGNLDQQAGIKWVKRNIKAFGGDPDNITIAGQSAGGGSVLSQITSPQNEGLIQKAIIMSGMIRSPYREDFIGIPDTLETAEKKGEDFFAYLGVSTLEEARKIDAFELLHKYSAYAQDHPRMFTIEDGQFTVGDAMKRLAGDGHLDIPIMSGNTMDEFHSFLPAESKEEFEQKVRDLFGENADAFLACPEVYKTSADGKLYGEANSIEASVKAEFLLNKERGSKQNFYYYNFDVDIPGWDNPGTFHSVDLWFFFETLAKCWRPFTGHHYDVARQMCNYLVNFVKTGDPNGEDADGSKMPAWQPYTKETPCSMYFTKDGATPKSGDNALTQALIQQMKTIMTE